MRAVDTNVVVRYLTGDDPVQAGKARALIENEPVFVPRTVVLEVEWVLRGVYELPARQIVAALRALAGLPGVSLEDAPIVARAMNWADEGMDFADALHLAAADRCKGFVTFDKRFASSAIRRSSVPVTVP